MQQMCVKRTSGDAEGTVKVFVERNLESNCPDKQNEAKCSHMCVKRTIGDAEGTEKVDCYAES